MQGVATYLKYNPHPLPQITRPTCPQLASFSDLSSSFPLFPALSAATLLPKLIQPPGLSNAAFPLPGG